MTTKKKKAPARKPAKRAAAKKIWKGPPGLRDLLVPIRDLTPDPKNPRTHSPRNLDAIRASVTAYGQMRPLVVRREGMRVCAGNGTLNVLQGMGWTHVAAVVADLSDAQARAYAIADNRSGELGAWDFAQLARDLSDPELENLVGSMGFTAEEINDLLDQAGELPPEDDDDDDDEAGELNTKGQITQTLLTTLKDDEPPPLPKEAVARRGDVWRCGAHEILCADSFDDETAVWIGRATTDVVVTDPPYAIFGSSTGVSSDIADDKMVRPFFAHLGRLCAHALKLFGHAYVFTDWRSWAALWEGLRPTPLSVRNMLIWTKGGGLGTNYAMTHELVAFAHMLPPEKAVRKRGTGVRAVLKPNVMHYDRPTGDERQHHAAKPVPLLGQLIANSTEEGGVVLDPFGGSGSTLIAAEKTGRRARVIEIEPKCVDVMVTRWEALTGDKAERVKR